MCDILTTSFTSINYVSIPHSLSEALARIAKRAKLCRSQSEAGTMDLKEAIKQYADLMTLGSVALQRYAGSGPHDTQLVSELLALLDQIDALAADLKLLAL